MISGVTSFGLFAELPNTIEGFIPIESLLGEYQYDPDTFRLFSPQKTYTLGDEVKIKVIDVDFERRRAEFRLITSNDSGRYKIIKKGRRNNESDYNE